MNQLDLFYIKVDHILKMHSGIGVKKLKIQIDSDHSALVISTSGFRKLLHQGLKNSHSNLTHSEQSTTSLAHCSGSTTWRYVGAPI
jgi:hypothetical protein